MKWAQIGASVFLFLVICLTALVYSVGITGPWMLDDKWNLRGFYNASTIDSFEAFLGKVYSVTSGPSSRPVSFLSFLLDDFAMPQDPADFKRTNICLHLLNGLIACLLFQKLFLKVTRSEKDALYLALSVSAIWMIHPLNVTTTLYVIQRMTQLSCLFTLLSLLCYVNGRMMYPKNSKLGALLILTGLVPLPVLAVLSKENGALIPLFIIVIESTIFRDIATPKSIKIIKWALVFFPAILILAYISSKLGDFSTGYEKREFSFLERVMTQPRVILDYVTRILMPTVVGAGLSHDDFGVSKSLFEPASTFFAILAVVAALVFATMRAGVTPVFSFSMLFFAAGHSLESTVLPLELYFEHRNYTPMFGILAGCLWASYLFFSKLKVKSFYLLFVICVVIGMAVKTYTIASEWSSAESMVNTDFMDHPSSYRANVNLASYQYQSENFLQSKELYLRAEEKFSDDIAIHLSLFLTKCRLSDAGKKDFEVLVQKVKEGKVRVNISTIIQSKVENFDEYCEFIDQNDIVHLYSTLAAAAESFPHSATHYNIYWHWALRLLKNRNLNEFMEKADIAYNLSPKFEIRIIQAKALRSAGLPEASREFLGKAEISLKESRMPEEIKRRELELLRSITITEANHGEE